MPIIDRKEVLFDISALNFEKSEIELQTQATANVTEPYGHIEYDLNGNEHFEAQVITISD
jgi:hypothetical protein